MMQRPTLAAVDKLGGVVALFSARRPVSRRVAHFYCHHVRRQADAYQRFVHAPGNRDTLARVKIVESSYHTSRVVL